MGRVETSVSSALPISFDDALGEHLVLAVNLPRNARTPVKASMIEPDMTQLAWTRTRQNEEHWILSEPG
jgi:hypothetical protein